MSDRQKQKQGSPLVEGILWILENRKQPNGKRWSMRALSEAAGLAPSHIEGIVNGRQRSTGLDTAEAIARVGNVKTSWLQKGAGLREPYEGDGMGETVPSATPSPPVSETRVTSDAIDDLINAAYNPARHQPSDVRLVVDALESQSALLRGHEQPSYVASALLDAVALARTKGRRLTAEELPAYALGTTKHDLSWAEERIAQFEAEADASLRAKGLEPRDTPHPALLAAQRRAGFTGTGGPAKGE
jgi:transcriptional regulator with XRE-family HTH domain